jgi:hypothetical protein
MNWCGAADNSRRVFEIFMVGGLIYHVTLKLEADQVLPPPARLRAHASGAHV